MPEKKKSLSSRLKQAWNIFTNKNLNEYQYTNVGAEYSYRPDRNRYRPGNERSIIASVYNRIAVDVSMLEFKHAKLDQNGRFLEIVDDDLNRVLSLEANEDQTGRELIQDIVESVFDEGAIAVVPTATDRSIFSSPYFSIERLRTAKILGWYPEHVRVSLYNSKAGCQQELILPKKSVAIIENPFYSVMNENNSIVKRLIYKLNLMDSIDEKAGSNKLDLIIQLPYIARTDAKRAYAEKRRKDIEMQLMDSKYGIAYTDGTEKITQLNRAIENNLMPQIEYLTKMLFSQLSMDQSVLNGTASELVMNNYYHQTIELIASVISDEFKRKFLSKIADSEDQSIVFFRNSFKLVPVSQMSNIANAFVRNEIFTPNEIRQLLGVKPSDDPKADKLHNSNMPRDETELSEYEEY